MYSFKALKHHLFFHNNYFFWCYSLLVYLNLGSSSCKAFELSLFSAKHMAPSSTAFHFQQFKRNAYSDSLQFYKILHEDKSQEWKVSKIPQLPRKENCNFVEVTVTDVQI